jgi:hypothetical protein
LRERIVDPIRAYGKIYTGTASSLLAGVTRRFGIDRLMPLCQGLPENSQMLDFLRNRRQCDFQIVMPQQNLNGVQVGAGFQHVRGEAADTVALCRANSIGSSWVSEETRRSDISYEHR